MKKILKSSMCIYFCLMLILISCSASMAVISKYTNVYFRSISVNNKNGTTEYYIKSDGYHNTGDTLKYMQGSNTYDYSDKKWEIFCIEPGVSIQSSDTATTTNSGRVWNTLSDDQKTCIHYALACGYYGNNMKVTNIANCSTSECIMATQLIIWEAAKNYRNGLSNGFTLKKSTNNYLQYAATSSKNPGIYRAYNYISSFMKACSLSPSFADNSTYTLKKISTDADGYNYCLKLTDTNGVYRNYDSDSDSWKWYWQNESSWNALNLTDDSGNKIYVSSSSDGVLTIKSKAPVSKLKITLNEDYLNSCKESLRNKFSTSDGYVLEYDYNSSYQAVIVAANPSYVKIDSKSFYIDTKDEKGTFKIKKQSANPELTDNNSCYSLEDAQYGIYSDKECTKQIDTLITDKDGDSQTISLDSGEYYVKEIKAPQGYNLEYTKDGNEIIVHTISISPGQNVILSASDVPVADPIGVILKKRNATTQQYKLDIPIKDAHYEFCYYPGYYDSIEELPEKYTYHYILKTDENGLCYLDEDYLVFGDELIHLYDSSFAVLPLGTITIKELKAPEGFYLDENTYLRQIKNVNEDIVLNSYDTPISDEFEILNLTISGEKKWNDDFDRDGIRPDKVKVNLIQDGKVYRTVTVSDKTNWKYEFTDIPEACIDMDAENYRHYYSYSITEDSVYGYTSSIPKITFDETDITKGICNIVNTHQIEQISLSGKKTWNDFDNITGQRPNEIEINLYANGVYVKSQLVTKNDRWNYEFLNLPKYYDKGKEITYTVKELPLDLYIPEYDKLNITNNLVTGSVTLIKTDGYTKGLDNVTFNLYTSDGKLVNCEYTNDSYEFKSLGEDSPLITDNEGKIQIENLPCGNYYFREITPKEGYMPYEGKIEFTISNESEDMLHRKITVKNNRALMYNTGSVGNIVIYCIAGGVLLIAVITLIYYKVSKKKTTNSNTKNNKENQ